MSLTFIDTNKIARAKTPGAGELAEILNHQLCGAENVVGKLHWLRSGESLSERCDEKTHQVIYLMEGEGTITLNAKDYAVKKGAGVYLGPSESSSIKQSGSEPLKLFHLVVTKSPG
jgi:glyoxylate utilization-related uncharacterized protein